MVSSVWTDSATCMTSGPLTTTENEAYLEWTSEYPKTVSAQVALVNIQRDVEPVDEGSLSKDVLSIQATIYRYITESGGGEAQTILNGPVLNAIENVSLIQFKLTVSGAVEGSLKHWSVGATMVATVFVQ